MMGEANRLTEEPGDTLASQWKTFLKVLTNPLVAIFLSAAIASLCFESIVDPRNRWVDGVLTLLVSILAGVTATAVTRRWSAITEQGVAVVRGKSAIRNLTFQLNSLGLLKNRVHLFNSRLKERCSKEMMVTYFEDILDKCSSLELNAVNSIEDWSDIIPSAQARTKIALISDLQDELAEKSMAIDYLADEVKATQNESGKETERLQQELQKARNERDQVKKELAGTKSTINRSVLSGIGDVPIAYPVTRGPGTLSYGPTVAWSAPQAIASELCRQCGNVYRRS